MTGYFTFRSRVVAFSWVEESASIFSEPFLISVALLRTVLLTVLSPKTIFDFS